MNKHKKAILIILLPAVMTLYFIFWILVPSIQNLIELKDKFKQTKATYNQQYAQVQTLKNNKKLIKEIAEINSKVSDFDIQMPSEFQDEFLLVDLSTFSVKTKTKIISLDAKTEKEVKIANSNDDKKKKKRKKGKKEEKSNSPLNILEKPFEFKVLGHYNSTITFVKMLESYQRKFIINGISAQISKNDERNPNPKIELTITGSTYKSLENPNFLEPEDKKEEKSKEDKEDKE